MIFMVHHIFDVKTKVLKFVTIGVSFGFMFYIEVALGQSIPPRPPRPPVRVEAEVEPRERGRREGTKGTEQEEAALDRDARVAEMIRTGRIIARSGDAQRATPANIRPSFESVPGAQTSQPPLEPVRLPPNPQAGVREQIEPREPRESIAVLTLRARINAERNPEYREMLEAALRRLLKSK